MNGDRAMPSEFRSKPTERVPVSQPKSLKPISCQWSSTAAFAAVGEMTFTVGRCADQCFGRGVALACAGAVRNVFELLWERIERAGDRRAVGHDQAKVLARCGKLEICVQLLAGGSTILVGRKNGQELTRGERRRRAAATW